MVVAVAFSHDGKRSPPPRTTRRSGSTTPPAANCPALSRGTPRTRGVAFSLTGNDRHRAWTRRSDCGRGDGARCGSRRHTAEVNCVRFSPTARSASAGWTRVSALGRRHREGGATLEGHTDFVRDLAFTSDGKRVVSSGKDGPIRIWDVEKRRLVKTLEGHDGWSAAGPVARRQVVGHGGWDGKLLVGLRRGESSSVDGGVMGFQVIAFSPNGKTLATADRLQRAFGTSSASPTTRRNSPQEVGAVPVVSRFTQFVQFGWSVVDHDLDFQRCSTATVILFHTGPVTRQSYRHADVPDARLVELSTGIGVRIARNRA